MELVEGETLRDWIERHWKQDDAADTEACTALVTQLCEALAYAHDHGIVHGDLKPDNVVLRPNARPVLVDFGLARRIADPAGRAILGEATEAAGTPLYMAPEQLRGSAPDARSDLWALGAMLHEMLTGSPPTAPACRAACADDVRSARSRTSALHAVAARLLAPDPRDRFGHALDVAAALGLGAATPAATRTSFFRPSFTGRDAVLDRLVGAVHAARRSAGALVFLVAPSGMGKTRTLAELVRLAAPRMQVVTGGSTPIGGQRIGFQGKPLHPLDALLEAIEVVRPAVQPARSEAPSLATDPGARERIARDLLDGIDALAAKRPLALVLDDLQWADELTLALLRALPIDWLAARPIVLIAALRSDAPAPLRALAARSDAEWLELGPLSCESTSTLLAEMLALERPADAIAARLQRVARGNPLHVTELVRLGFAEGWLRRVAPGRLVLADSDAEPTPAALETLPLPASLDALLERRLGGFDARARGLIEAGAVLGREFVEALLYETADLEPAEGVEIAGDLVAREVLAADASGCLRFAHDLLAERAYHAIPEARRRELHARAGGALERLDGGTAPPFAALAHHWSLAGDALRERSYRDRAAEAALASAAFEEARAHLRRALQIDASLAAGGRGVAPLQRARWHLGLARSAHALSDAEAMESEARAACGALGSALPRTPAQWTRLSVREAIARLTPRFAARNAAARERHLLTARAADVLVHHYFYVDDLVAMVGSALVAARGAERGGDAAAAARSWMVLASLFGLLRLHGAAERNFARGQRAATRGDDRSEQAYCLATRAVYHANFGDFAAAEAAVERAERCLEGVDDPFQREIVLTMRGHVAHFTGRYGEASRAYRAVLDSARCRHNDQRTAWGLFSLSRTALVQGRVGEARAQLEEADALLRRAPELQSEVICTGLLALARLQCGDEPGARDAARAASDRIERSRPSGFPAVAGYAALAETWRALARGDAALGVAERRHLRAFRRFARYFPMAAPACGLAEARLLAARGARRRARVRLARSLARARAFRMPLEEAQALLGLAWLAPAGSALREGCRREADAILARIEALVREEREEGDRWATPSSS